MIQAKPKRTTIEGVRLYFPGWRGRAGQKEPDPELRDLMLKAARLHFAEKTKLPGASCVAAEALDDPDSFWLLLQLDEAEKT